MITVAGVTSISKREQRDVELGYDILIKLSKIYGITSEFAKEGGILHAETRKK